jgi:hypothetical protein
VVPVLAVVTAGRLARGIRQLLVQWQGEPAASASWEDYDDFRAHFPDFQLEDELVYDGGRDVMCGRTYARRARDVRRGTERAARTQEGKASG